MHSIRALQKGIHKGIIVVRRVTTVLVAALVLLSAARTDEINYKITGHRAKEHIKVLAADDMKGRLTGTPEAIRAADYCADQMKKLGLAPAGDEGTYMQALTVPLVRTVPPISFTIEGEEPFTYGTQKDYVALQYSGEGKTTGEIVFVGYGISDSQKGFDEYAGIDVKGKIVMAIRRSPNDDETWGAANFIGYKSKTARDKGAAGFILVARQPKQGTTMPLPGTIQAEYYCRDMPAICVSSTAADRILAGAQRSIRDLQEQIDSTGKPATTATGVTATIEVHGVYDPEAPTKNVLGILPGADPKLKDEYVVISAHIDHIGEGPGGEIYNGADDDGSGVGAMLEIMEAMVKNKVKPKRSILFAGWTGEEIGLVGSRHWVDNPTIPLDKVVCDLHMDMVGRGIAEANAFGATSFPEFWQRIKDAPRVDMTGIHEARTGGGSDHAAFAGKKIPGIMVYSRGEHPDYHAPSDTWERMQPEVLGFCAQFVYNAALAAADDPGLSPPLASRHQPEEALPDGS
jgi:hypothetical protein